MIYKQYIVRKDPSGPKARKLYNFKPQTSLTHLFLKIVKNEAL
jgi:hypothetical protein